MLKHSPTPWTIEPGEEHDERQIWDKDLQCVAIVYGFHESEHPGPLRDQLEADTRLLHAAPRMYALLRQIVAWKPEHGPYEGWMAKIENLLNDIEEPQ